MNIPHSSLDLVPSLYRQRDKITNVRAENVCRRWKILVMISPLSTLVPFIWGIGSLRTYPSYDFQATEEWRDLKATVPRFEPCEKPKVKMIQWIIFKESVGATSGRRWRTQDGAVDFLQKKGSLSPPWIREYCYDTPSFLIVSFVLYFWTDKLN